MDKWDQNISLVCFPNYEYVQFMLVPIATTPLLKVYEKILNILSQNTFLSKRNTSSFKFY